MSIRGRILSGKVISTKMTRTVIIRREYLHYVPKYNRYERRHKNLAVHVSPAFRVEVGDIIVAGMYDIFFVLTCAGQCRPLSKTVRFNALKVIKNKSTERAKMFHRY